MSLFRKYRTASVNVPEDEELDDELESIPRYRCRCFQFRNDSDSKCQKIRLALGTLLSLLCLVGILYYWGVNISKMSSMWKKYQYSFATGYSADEWIIFDNNGSNSSTYHLYAPMTLIIDPEKSGFTREQRKLFNKNKLVWINDSRQKLHLRSTDGSGSNRLDVIQKHSEGTEFLELVCLQTAKVLVTIGFALKFLLLLAFWIISWSLTIKNFVSSLIRERLPREEFQEWEPNFCNSGCASVCKCCGTTFIGMVIPLTVTVLLLPFLALEFENCVFMIHNLTDVFTFEFVMITFTVCWIFIFICLIGACCCCCCVNTSNTGACTCCEYLGLIVVAVFTVFSCVIGMICVCSTDEVSVLQYAMYVFSVSSLQIWLCLCVSSEPKCTGDTCCCIRSAFQGSNDEDFMY